MRQLGSLRTDNPWPIIGWGAAAAIIVVAGALGLLNCLRFRGDGRGNHRRYAWRADKSELLHANTDRR